MLNNSEARRRAVTLPSSFDVVLNVVGTRTSQGASSQPTPNDNGYFHAVVELLDGSKYTHTLVRMLTHMYTHTHTHTILCLTCTWSLHTNFVIFCLPSCSQYWSTIDASHHHPFQHHHCTIQPEQHRGDCCGSHSGSGHSCSPCSGCSCRWLHREEVEASPQNSEKSKPVSHSS